MFAEDEPVVAPEVYLEWLATHSTCEWCGEIIGWIDPATGQLAIKPAEWLCRVEKRGGYTSKHWRRWRVCQKCHLKGVITDFSKWIFPVIKNMPLIGDSLAALMQVQPMGVPSGEIFYADLVERPLRGRRRERVVLDDATFYDRPEHARAYAERMLNVDLYVKVPVPLETIKVDFAITPEGVVKA